MNKEVKNLPASIQRRLRNKAIEQKRPAAWIQDYYANERFLYRLSRSEHCQKFVLKGGLVFIGWGIPLRRHTKDIDFRAYTNNNLEDVVQIIKEVCLQDVEPDGIVFESDTVTAEVISEGPEYEYPGTRVHLWARLGETSRVRIKIDIGFSDEIVPKQSLISYPTVFKDMPSPIIQGYPKESVVAEKFHCIVFRGSINSRMKDFYDIWFISQHFDFDGLILQNAMVNTFNNRGTVIPVEVPVGLSDSYAKDNEQRWQAFLKTFDPDFHDINHFKDLIQAIRVFLFPVINAITGEVTFNSRWRAGANWS